MSTTVVNQLTSKLFLQRVLVIAFVISLYSCSEKKSETETPAGTIKIDLKKYGKPFSIFVPDTGRSPLTIQELSTGGLEIRSGKNFGLLIQDQFTDLNQVRGDLKEDDVNKLKSIMTDEPELLVWESEITQPEFHFYLNKKIKNSEYSFEDLKSTELEPFGKNAILEMVERCKSAGVEN